MFDTIFKYLSLINLQVFLFSILCFLIGYVLAPTVYYKKIGWLIRYPMWIAAKLEMWSKKRWNPYILFLFLIGLNSLSLMLNFVSGLVLFLPLIFAVWTGLNIGLVTYHTLKGEFYYVSLINPVAVFELPAAFIAFTAAFQLNIHQLGIKYISLTPAGFSDYFNLVLITVFPLLVISGIIETGLILLSQRLENGKDDK